MSDFRPSRTSLASRATFAGVSPSWDEREDPRAGGLGTDAAGPIGRLMQRDAFHPLPRPSHPGLAAKVNAPSAGAIITSLAGNAEQRDTNTVIKRVACSDHNYVLAPWPLQ